MYPRYQLTQLLVLSILMTLQLMIPAKAGWFSSSDSIRHALIEQAPNINPEALDVALDAYECAIERHLDKKHILTVIDYSLPSNKKRMWVFDMDEGELLYNTYVAHGKGSGLRYATHFSNHRGSKASSLGVLLTGRTYYGHRGYSLRLYGLEKGINDHVFTRHVVIHPAWYASLSFLNQYGRLGRSYGCPAIGRKHSREIIDTIKNKTLVVGYYPDDQWMDRSKYLQCTG